MTNNQIEKEVRIEVPPHVRARAERRAEEEGGLAENYLLDEVDLKIKWVLTD